jgi:hypothetical protein
VVFIGTCKPNILKLVHIGVFVNTVLDKNKNIPSYPQANKFSLVIMKLSTG